MLPKTITKKELSVLLDISQKRIEELVKEDVLTKNRAGSFDISNITDFVNYERAKLPEEITLSDLAKLFGLTERRVQQLAEDEIAERISRGKYKFIPSLKNYIESLKSAYGEIEDEDGNIKQVDLNELKIKKQIGLIDIQTRDRKLKYRKTKGELYEAKDVENVWARNIGICKAKLINIAPRLAPILKGEEDSKIIEQKIDFEVTQALESMADINVDDFKSSDLIEIEEDDFEDIEIAE